MQLDVLAADAVRLQVLRVLSQQNFEVNEYTAILSRCLRLFMRGDSKKDLEVRKDLPFWIEALKYVPRLAFKSAAEVQPLIEVVKQLDDELVELDFFALIEYLV